jgi:4-amino-4-deoxy-L-arabinose transferase-like glycosyltransferase/Flp pilus assembly protein TadD
LGLPVVLLLAAGVRGWDLARESLWFDEILTAGLARGPLAAIAPILLRYDIHPPLHYYAVWASLRLFSGLGVEIAARLPSALASVAAAGVLYALVRNLWRSASGWAVGLVAAALFALAPFQVEYAQEARHYAFLVCWTLVAAWGLTAATQRERAAEPSAPRDVVLPRDTRVDRENVWRRHCERSEAISSIAGWGLLRRCVPRNDSPLVAAGGRAMAWALWLIAGAAALYTHYFAVLPLIGLALYGAWSVSWLLPRDPRRFALYLLLMAAPFLFFAPWLIQGGQQLAQMTGRSGSVVETATARLFSLPLLRELAYALGAGAVSPWRKGFVLLAVLGVAGLLLRRERRALCFIALWCLPSLAFLLIMPRQPVPYRYFIFWGPVFSLLVAAGAGWLAGVVAGLVRRPRLREPGVLLLGGLTCLMLLPGLRDYYATHKHDWRGLARLVESAPPIPLYAPWMPEVASFYAQPEQRPLIRDARQPDELRGQLAGQPRAWLVANSIQRAFDPADRLGDAWRPLPHVDLALWGDLHLVYVGDQASPATLAAEVERLPLRLAATVWTSLGRAYRQAGDGVAAERVLRRAAQLATAECDPFAMREAAGELRLLGLHREAMDLYRPALARMPNDIQTRLGLAASAVALQHGEEALVILAALPPAEAAQYWPARLVGEAHRQQGRLAEALAHFRLAQAANPSDPDICALLAMTGAEAQDRETAAAWWRRYLELAPQGPFRAAACRSLGDDPGSACPAGK